MKQTHIRAQVLTQLTATGIVPLAVEKCGRNKMRLCFEADAGLHRLSIIADGAKFNWEELYLDLYKYGNTGQRTGPWDFSLEDHRLGVALMPSYWVTLNGESLGLWYFQRITVEDIANKRFRGNMAFHIAQGGVQELTLERYRDFKVKWMSACLEPDPEDTILPRLPQKKGLLPAEQWADPAFWEGFKRNLQGPLKGYRRSLKHAVKAILKGRDDEWQRDATGRVVSKNVTTPDHMLLLYAAWRMTGKPEALQSLLEWVDEWVEKPHWGGKGRPDSYGYNGDMGAMMPLRTLSWMIHLLRDELGSERRARMLDKLAYQGDAFFRSCLLMRDYWGGSLLQDHGWRAVVGFGTAALYLADLLPQARIWCRYALPRIERAIRAIPRDGVVPPSSYNNLFLYTGELSRYRDTLLAWSGDDLFEMAPFHRVIDYLCKLHGSIKVKPSKLNFEPGRLEGKAGNLFKNMLRGSMFLNQIARKYNDGRAARLEADLMADPANAERNIAHALGVLEAALCADGPVKPVARLAQPQRMHYFEDSALVHFYDPATQAEFEVQCGPKLGYHAYRHAPGPCDRVGGQPGAGHFTLRVGEKELLVSPDSRYSLRSNVRTCLLLDGQGQIGDIGYPMSMPSFKHPGQHISEYRWDEKSGCAFVRLDLQAAYPETLRVVSYTRDFLLFADQRKLIVRDHVLVHGKRRFEWLFQTDRVDKPVIGAKKQLRATVGGQLTIAASPLGFEVDLSAADTEIVTGYTSADRQHAHLSCVSKKKCSAVAIDFVLQW